MNETKIRKGIIMKRTMTLALLGLACLLAMPSIAPARYADGMNLYQYVKSAPSVYVDPDGRRPAHPLEFSGGTHGVRIEPGGGPYSNITIYNPRRYAESQYFSGAWDLRQTKGYLDQSWDRIQREVILTPPARVVDCCLEGVWNAAGGTATLSLQLGMGIILGRAQYRCDDNPDLVAAVTVYGIHGGGAARAKVMLSSAGFMQITGAKTTSELDGKLVIDTLTYVEASLQIKGILGLGAKAGGIIEWERVCRREYRDRSSERDWRI